MKRHFDQWGWINFLKTIAETKVFDIAGSGKNSIDCAREANLFDVLLFASEEKSYSESQALDWEEDARRPRSKNR